MAFSVNCNCKIGYTWLMDTQTCVIKMENWYYLRNANAKIHYNFRNGVGRMAYPMKLKMKIIILTQNFSKVDEVLS